MIPELCRDHVAKGPSEIDAGALEAVPADRFVDAIRARAPIHAQANQHVIRRARKAERPQVRSLRRARPYVVRALVHHLSYRIERFVDQARALKLAAPSF